MEKDMEHEMKNEKYVGIKEPKFSYQNGYIWGIQGI